MNKDAMNSVLAHQGLDAAFVVLDSVQSLPPHKQVLGVTLLFHLMCERLNLDKSEMLNKAERIAKDADSHYHHHLRAVHAFIDNEIKRK